MIGLFLWIGGGEREGAHTLAIKATYILSVKVRLIHELDDARTLIEDPPRLVGVVFAAEVTLHLPMRELIHT